MNTIYRLACSHRKLFEIIGLTSSNPITDAVEGYRLRQSGAAPHHPNFVFVALECDASAVIHWMHDGDALLKTADLELC
jgi:hypothetical protein